MAQAAHQTLPLRRDRYATATGSSTWRTTGWLPLLALLGGLICLIYLIATSSVLSVGYDIQQLNREQEDWLARNEQLQLELAKVRSLAWIEAQATARLGMTKPEELTYVRVDQPVSLALEIERPDAETASQRIASEPPATTWQQLAGRVSAFSPGQP